MHNSYEGNFRRIVEMIAKVDIFNTAMFTNESDFDAGSPAMLHFVIMRCRSSELHLRAQSLLKAQCRPRKNCAINLSILYETARKPTEGEYAFIEESRYVPLKCSSGIAILAKCPAHLPRCSTGVNRNDFFEGLRL